MSLHYGCLLQAALLELAGTHHCYLSQAEGGGPGQCCPGQRQLHCTRTAEAPPGGPNPRICRGWASSWSSFPRTSPQWATASLPTPDDLILNVQNTFKQMQIFVFIFVKSLTCDKSSTKLDYLKRMNLGDLSQNDRNKSLIWK